jgi:hypothetical protein
VRAQGDVDIEPHCGGCAVGEGGGLTTRDGDGTPERTKVCVVC